MFVGGLQTSSSHGGGIAGASIEIAGINNSDPAVSVAAEYTTHTQSEMVHSLILETLLSYWSSKNSS